jgi:hypothetical protein
MTALISVGRTHHRFETVPQKSGFRNWTERMWIKFVDWLTDPIPFPGKWPVRSDHAARYNTGKEKNDS